jgi:hypothetical protein
MSLITYQEWFQQNESVGKLRKVYSGDESRLKTLKKTISSVMPKEKVQHSFRVGTTAAKAGLDSTYVDAAVLHDYLERGGDPKVLEKLGLSDSALSIIKLLSIDEKNPGMDDNEAVYQHVLQMLRSNEPQRVKDIAIIIKCSDRLDNLRKRVKRSNLTSDYYKKSMKLLNLLMGYFRGPSNWIKFIRNKLTNLNSKIAEMKKKRLVIQQPNPTVPHDYTPMQVTP